MISYFPVSSQDFFCFLSRDQLLDVTPLLGAFVILECYFISRSCIFVPATYYDYAIIGVLRPLWLTEILF